MSTGPRGRVQVRDPAQAIAMAKCWLSTWVRRASRAGIQSGLPDEATFHPTSGCGYCEVPRDLLIQSIEEFESWANLHEERAEAPLRMEVEQWLTLPEHEQKRLVLKAQGLKEEAEEMLYERWSS